MTPSEALMLIDLFLGSDAQAELGAAMGGDYFDRAVACARRGDEDGANAIVQEWADHARRLGPLEWDEMFDRIRSVAGEPVADGLRTIAG